MLYAKITNIKSFLKRYVGVFRHKGERSEQRL